MLRSATGLALVAFVFVHPGAAISEDRTASGAGNIDGIIWPDQQKEGERLNSLTVYLDAFSDVLPKAKGVIRVSNDNDTLGHPDFRTAKNRGPLTCALGI